MGRTRSASRVGRLWRCARCGARLVTRNLWHSCGRSTLADWNARMNPHTRGLFRRFCDIIASFGEYRLAPARTRIAIMARVRFAGLTRLSAGSITISFALPRRLRSSRFVAVSEVAPGWWAHRLRVTAPGQLDRQLTRWLEQSYHLMGMQERLSRRSSSKRSPAKR